MLHRIAGILSEPVMGFLALAALVFGVAPELFAFSKPVNDALNAGEWAVIALFAVEYSVNFVLAQDKLAFVRNPWRLLDLFIILAPFVTLIPDMPAAARSAPFLRVLRLLRAIVAGTRASRRLRHHQLAAARRHPTGAPIVTELDPDSPQASERTWPELLEWLRKPDKGWIHAGNLEPARIDEIAHVTGVPRQRIELALGEASYPRMDSVGHWTVLTMPLPKDDGTRDANLLLIAKKAVISLSLFKSELQHSARPLPGAPGDWPMRVALGVVRLAMQRHEDVAGRFERGLRALEELPADESPHEFFVETFRMRKRITTSKADLWRLHGVLSSIVEGRRSLPGFTEHAKGDVARIAEEASFLHETADGLREALLSLLDLHLNISGYGMNRFMRLLAIVSALGLIPAVVGGMLGMNLTTNPWPATLAQVSFGVFVAMLSVLYIFQAKGWLKS